MIATLVFEIISARSFDDGGSVHQCLNVTELNSECRTVILQISHDRRARAICCRPTRYRRSSRRRRYDSNAEIFSLPARRTYAAAMPRSGSKKKRAKSTGADERGIAQRRSGLLTKLQHLRTHLPPTAARIAAYIVDHAEAVIRMSITELAEQTHAAEGSIIGLCRRAGVAGFQELKILLARDLVEPIRFIQEDLREGDSFDVVADRIFAAHAASLTETRPLLSGDTLGAAVRAIRRASRIEIYGIGSSAPIAQDLAYRLMQLGLDAKALTDSHVQAVAAAMSGPGVTTITVSHTASTIETVTASRYAKEAGARTIGITRLGKSPLARYCDILLYTVAKETTFRPEAMSSRVAQLAVIDTLVSCCALADPERSIERLQHSNRVLSAKRY